jgi:hypothetical protein
MGRTWVLHTETKGTGAQMVPLEHTQTRSSESAPVFVRRTPRPRSTPETPGSKAPYQFKVVDLVTRETLVDRASTREVVDALKAVRSPVDVNVYVWRPEQDRWRLLTIEEKRAIWDLRGDA